MMSFRIAGALALATALAGCGGGDWMPPAGMSDAQARVTFYECKRDGQAMIAQSVSNLPIAIMQATECMQAHGFVRGAP